MNHSIVHRRWFSKHKIFTYAFQIRSIHLLSSEHIHLDFWSISSHVYDYGPHAVVICHSIAVNIVCRCCFTCNSCSVLSKCSNAQMLMLECSVECVHLNCKNIKIILHWFNAIDDSHKKWHLSKHYCFITSKAQKFRENGMAAKRWVSERQWMNASKNIAMNVSTNDSCRSCTKYKQCLINCYWMVNWIFEPRELVMPRINICRKAFWAQSFALELWIKTEIMVHIRNMNIGFEIWNVNMA